LDGGAYDTDKVLVTDHFHAYSNGASDDELIRLAETAEEAFNNLLTFFSMTDLIIPTDQEKFELIYEVNEQIITQAFRYGFIISKIEFGVNLEVIQHELGHNFQFILSDNTFDRHRWLYEGVAHIMADYKTDKITTVSQLEERQFFFVEVMNVHIMDIDLNGLLDGFEKYDNMVYHYYSLAHLMAEYVFDPNGFGLSKSDIKQMYLLMADGNTHVEAINKLSGKNILVLIESLFTYLKRYLLQRYPNG